METAGNNLRCEKCGGTVFDSLVQRGSYLLRCRSCREIGPATSWCALGPRWSRALSVFRDGEQTGGPLLAGVGSEIWHEVARLASDGTTLILHDNPV